MELSEVTRTYDRASKHYDVFADLVLGKLLRAERNRERAVELLGDIEGATVLDVGCGTGRNFPLLVPRVGQRGRVIGLDYSEGMLRQARRRIAKHGFRNVELVRGDASTLKEVGEPVDALISVWCYGIVHDLTSALNAAIDAVRPGGAISIMAFGRSRPEREPLRSLYPLYRFAVRRSGMDSAGDIEDAKLQARWAHGRALLQAKLGDLHEESYLFGTGILLASRKPLEHDASVAQQVAGGRI